MPSPYRETLEHLCAELASDPATSNPELGGQLRGWSIYSQGDGSHGVPFDCVRVDEHASAALASATITSLEDGGIALRMPLTEAPPATRVCREAARAAATPIDTTDALHIDEEFTLHLRLEPGAGATELAEALCTFERAALHCAREVQATAQDEALAEAYLASRAATAGVRDADAA